MQKWRARYERDGISGLGDLPRSGKPLVYSQADRARLIAKACTRPPETPEGAQQERWTYEQLGQAVGMSASQAHDRQPEAERTGGADNGDRVVGLAHTPGAGAGRPLGRAR